MRIRTKRDVPANVVVHSRDNDIESEEPSYSHYDTLQHILEN